MRAHGVLSIFVTSATLYLLVINVSNSSLQHHLYALSLETSSVPLAHSSRVHACMGWKFTMLSESCLPIHKQSSSFNGIMKAAAFAPDTRMALQSSHYSAGHIICKFKQMSASPAEPVLAAQPWPLNTARNTEGGQPPVYHTLPLSPCKVNLLPTGASTCQHLQKSPCQQRRPSPWANHRSSRGCQG